MIYSYMTHLYVNAVCTTTSINTLTVTVFQVYLQSVNVVSKCLYTNPDQLTVISKCAVSQGCIYLLLKACHSQKNTQRLLNQGMPNYEKHIKIRHIFLSEALADKMYIRTQRSISSFLFIFNKTDPSILPNRMFLSGCQPDVFFCNHNTAARK